MAEQGGNQTVKIVIIVVCLVGAAIGLYLTFGPSPTPQPPERTTQPGGEAAPPPPEPDPQYTGGA